MIISTNDLLDGTEIDFETERYWAQKVMILFLLSNSESEVH